MSTSISDENSFFTESTQDTEMTDSSEGTEMTESSEDTELTESTDLPKNFQKIKEEIDFLKPYYQAYINGDGMYEFEHFDDMKFKVMEKYGAELIIKVLSYISSKRLISINPSRANMVFADFYIRQYLYFGICPELMNENERDIQFRKEYFLWQKIDSPTPRPTRDMILTPENFRQFSNGTVPFLVWTKQHYCTFIYTVILPELYQKLNKRMRSHIGVDWLVENVKSWYLKRIIKDYMKNKDKFFEQRDIQKARLFKCPFNKEQFKETFEYDSYDLSGVYYMYELLWKHMCHNRQDAEALWKKTSEQFIKHKDNTRFTWQKMCSPNYFKQYSKEELQEVAALEGIPSHLFLTKRELCGELAKNFSNLIFGKKRIEGQCNNSTTIIAGDDISNIPPEFFYAYSHNGRIFCDDIRDLQKLFASNGNKHPYDNTKLSKFVVNDVNRWHKHLVDTTMSMEDYDAAPEIQMSNTSLLSSKGALLLSKLNYPNDLRFFISADIEKVKYFITELRNEEIITRQEYMSLSILQNNEQLKLTLIELLVNKINNDPQRITVSGSLEPLSSIAINLSNVYNEIFKPE